MKQPITFCKMLVCIGLALIATGCQSDRHIKTTPGETLSFFDSKVFDLKLSESLASKPDSFEVTPSPAAALTINNIPEKLDKWFMVVYNAGGTVQAQQVDQVGSDQRGVAGLAIDLVVGVYNLVKDKILYKPAEGYNVTILYKDEGAIERIIFTKRTDE